ncbi:MAG: efflux RND transporter permease subunit, partial [Treponema sp.]|nr:efflux RND transporter permease subunit [Treponema sp.]
YRTRGAKPKISAILGSQEMIMSVVSGNLTTICVFLPFLFFINKLEIMGQLFKGIIFTIVIALLSSLFVAVFLVPVLAGKFLPLSNRAEKPVKNRVLKRLYGGFQRVLDVVTHAYRHALNAALDNRAVTLVISFSLFVIALVLLPTLRINLFGNDGGDDSVTLNVTMPLGTTLEETVSVVRRFEAIAQKEVVGYESITSSIGNRGRQGGSNSGTLQIQLPVASKQIDTSETIQQKLRAHFTEFADARFTFSAGWSRQMSGSDISIELRSKDLEAAVSVANKFKDVMETIGDIGEVSIDTEEGLPEVEIVIDRARAAQFGVDITTVATEISAAMNGTTATVYRTGGKEYDVKVMYRPEDREKMSDLSSIYVNGTGGMVTVSNFASLKRGLGPVSIRRTNQTRIVKVSANILTGENANVVEGRIKEAAADHFVVPDAVSVTYAGSWSTTRRQGGVYGSIALMALILVFGVMAGTYESFKAPIINMMTIPFLLIGVVAIYKLTGQAMSMTSMVGVIMLIGIVVNNGIILVDYTNLLRDRGYAMREACLEAGVSRLRPVLMTTLTTILGTLPMCFQSEGSAAMVQPIGMAIVGGLTSSTFVTLFFIPVFYSILMRRKNRSAAQLPAEIAEIAQSHDFPAGDGEVQMEIIANQSVEDDIVELLEQAVPDIRYTIIPTVTGRGKHDYKLGTTTWPERNFMLVAYLGREHVAMVQAAITFLKKRFPKEGIKLFVTGTER